MMSQKKIFLILLAVSTVISLLHHGGHFSWTMKIFRHMCPSIQSTQNSHPVKQTNVFFLKTHKTASSTMQNIFYRFAEHNNLTVGLPVIRCEHQFCYPQLFSKHFVHPHTIPPNIMTNHLRFSRSELQRLMPSNTTYITILREPGAMFESSFSYYKQHCEAFRRVPNGSLETFLNNPEAYYKKNEKNAMYARNTLTFDLGGNKDCPKADLEGYLKHFIAEVEYTFQLVMIAEYFDESLVLLRHLLSWDLEDVLYIKQNMRVPSAKSTISEEQLLKIRNWNAIDYALYKHFNETFWKQLKQIGLSCVEKEVNLFRQAQDQMMRNCFGKEWPQMSASSKITNKELRPWRPSSKVDIIGYNLPVNSTNSLGTCMKMILPEMQYTKQLLQNQILRYRNNYLSNAKQNQVWKQLDLHQQASKILQDPDKARGGSRWKVNRANSRI